ncbi:MAG TPA: SgcJ/EcaC family oxidoreductase [Candidatus Acidoferrum sp.]|nr:SgcJ/EcaC family oxidoreductase [Candidatus Acidoferrum sp.]
MRSLKLRKISEDFIWRIAVFVAIAGILVSPAFAQKNKKDQSKQPDAQPSGVQVTDDEAIDRQISQMLAAWQSGDAEGMHAFYADDVLVVSGVAEPPVSGWPAYLRAYQGQRARTQSVRIERSNTFRKIDGNSAWATYQWDLTGVMDGKATNAQGHTTLVFEKRNGKWLIVLNHTSLVP